MPMLPLLRSLLLSKQKMTVKNGLARCQLIFLFPGAMEAASGPI